jgi:hypothetical protein
MIDNNPGLDVLEHILSVVISMIIIKAVKTDEGFLGITVALPHED